jgi:hypothetical protein
MPTTPRRGSTRRVLAALTEAVQGNGPWLRQVPGTRHYTIVFKPQTDEVYAYPPGTAQPATFSQAHWIEVGNPCKRYAS